jgi:predicted RND superfamily exporter protein
MPRMDADRIAALLVRRRVLCVAAALCVATLSVVGAMRLRLDFSFRPFFLTAETDSPILSTLPDEFRNPAGASLVAVLHGGDVLAPEVLTAIEAASSAIQRLPHIERVISAATVPYLHGDGETVGMETLPRALAPGAKPAPPDRGDVLDNPLWQRRLVAPDGDATIIVATLERGFEGIVERAAVIDAFRGHVEEHLPPGIRAAFAGYALAEGEYARLALGGMVFAQTAATLAMAGVLYLCFGTLAGVLVPLAVVFLATVVTVGVMGFAGLPLTFTTVSVPLLIVVIGVAETSFFMTRYYEERARGGAPTEIARRAIARVLQPSVIAGITTALGFLSLWTGHIALTRDFGTAMASGVMATVLAAVLILPATLTFLAGRAGADARGLSLDRLLASLGALVWHRRTMILAGGAALLFIGMLGVPRIQVEQYATRELPAGHPLRVAQAIAEGSLMGAFELRVASRAADGGRITTPRGLRALDQLQDFLAHQAGVIKTWSIVDYLEEVNAALAGTGPDARRLPEQVDLVPQYLLLLRSIGQRVDVPELLDPTNHWASIGLGIADVGAGGLQRLSERLEAFLDDTLDGALDVYILGDYWLVTRGIASVTHDFVRSIAVSFLVVFVVMAVFLRSWRLTVLSMLPNVVPVVAALAVMGFGGIHLRVGTAIILPVSLGIAVDATVHYLARAREESSGAVTRDIAAARALAGVGRGMIFSGAALVAGFACLMLPDLRVFRDVALLGVTALGAAAMSDLFLLPALFATFGPGGAPEALTSRPRDSVSWTSARAPRREARRTATTVADDRGRVRASARWKTEEGIRRPQFGDRRT